VLEPEHRARAALRQHHVRHLRQGGGQRRCRAAGLGRAAGSGAERARLARVPPVYGGPVVGGDRLAHAARATARRRRGDGRRHRYCRLRRRPRAGCAPERLRRPGAPPGGRQRRHRGHGREPAAGVHRQRVRRLGDDAGWLWQLHVCGGRGPAVGGLRRSPRRGGVVGGAYLLYVFRRDRATVAGRRHAGCGHAAVHRLRR
jgi:hypothetical protein